MIEQSSHWKQFDKGERETQVASSPQRKTADPNMSEPGRSVVTTNGSNTVRECAEPLDAWRRQHRMTYAEKSCEHSGVTGRVCCEGYLCKDGRARISPVKWMECMKRIERPNAGRCNAFQSQEVSLPINGSEVADNGMRAVRQARSSNELPVTGREAKGPDFCSASNREQGGPSHGVCSTWA